MAYKIVLDAGHGGGDPGAVYQGRQEKDDTLTLTMAVGEILERNGIDVVYTRTEDIYQTPFEKAKLANESGADYFISFHRNSSPRDNQYQGAEVLGCTPAPTLQRQSPCQFLLYKAPERSSAGFFHEYDM